MKIRVVETLGILTFFLYFNLYFEKMHIDLWI